jgi:hypothetical protein
MQATLLLKSRARKRERKAKEKEKEMNPKAQRQKKVGFKPILKCNRRTCSWMKKN